MPSQSAHVDADFFAMIHQRIVELPDDRPSERRRHQRQRFLGIQRLAPWDGCKFPAEDAFVEVPCYDLTRSGFSFFAHQRPSFEQLVVGFGQKPNLLYISAKPVRFSPMLVFPSGRAAHVGHAPEPIRCSDPTGEIGMPMVLVGCRFLRRLEKPEG
jgi:hypothetical protein